MGGFVKFLLGGIAGAAVGAAVAGVLAPQRGAELQAVAHERLQAAKVAGDAAERETQQALQDRFRSRVGDPVAFTAEAGQQRGRG